MAGLNKRAIEIQFHWIFILIAGALILAFFFSVAQKQRSISQEKLAVTLSIDMDAIFSAASESKGTAQKLPVPSTGIAFTCSKTCDCNFRIGKRSTDFGDKIIFAPELLKESDGTAMALEFKMPFRTTNFLYLTNQRIKYYLIGDSTGLSFRQIVDAMPAGTDFETKQPSEVPMIRNQGHEETRFVFINVNNPSSINAENFKQSRVIKIMLSGNAVTFMDKKPGKTDFSATTSTTAGLASQLAAIFSADKDMYECGMKKAFKKLSNVASVSAQRAAKLGESELGQRCYYEGAKNNLEQIAKTAAGLSQNIDSTSINTLLTLASQLEGQNRALILDSCPEVY